MKLSFAAGMVREPHASCCRGRSCEAEGPGAGLLSGPDLWKRRTAGKVDFKVLPWKGGDCISELYKAGDRCCVAASRVGRSQPVSL